MSDRGISLDLDALRLTEIYELERSIAHVHEHLVHHRPYLAGRQDILQVILKKVRNAYGTDFASFICVFQRPPRLTILIEIPVLRRTKLRPWLRSMDDHQVEIIQTQLLQRLIYRCRSSVVCFMLRAYFSRDENLVPRNAASREPLPTPSSFP